MEYTLGPWHIGQGNGEGSVFAETGRMRLEGGITTLYPICKVIGFSDEKEANAYLIASAPELLEACKQAEISLANSVRDNEGGVARETSLSIVREAIAKAKGE